VLPQDLPVAERELAELTSGQALVETSPRRSFQRPTLRTPYLAPRDRWEEQVAAVWQEYLGVDRVGVHDPFFELGGTSLVGMAIATRLERDLGVTLPAASLLERPTVAGLATLLRGGPDGDRDDGARLDEESARGALRRRRAATGRRRTGEVAS
jgi:polyketide synthase 12